MFRRDARADGCGAFTVLELRALAYIFLTTVLSIVLGVLAWLVGLVLSIAILVLAVAVVRAVFWNPFKYPYKEIIWAPHEVSTDNLYAEIDRYITDEDNMRGLWEHEQRVERWRARSEKQVERYGKVIHSLADKLSDAMDDKHAYKLKIAGVGETSVSWAWICERAQLMNAR